MNDLLLEISKNPMARDLVKSLGLPLPMPEPLRRVKSPASPRLLDDKTIAYWAGPDLAVTRAVARTLTTAGAFPRLAGDADAAAAFLALGEAYGRPAQALPEPPVGEEKPAVRLDGMVIDATRFESTADLRALYDFFHPWIGTLNKCGRVVVLGRALDAIHHVAEAAIQGALDGFVKSVAKEIGKKGATATLVRITPGAEGRLGGALVFALSAQSAYTTGQTLTVSNTAADLTGPTPETRPLAGKVALVTGAARGIGEATARILAAEGAHVVCLDRPDDDGPTSKLARELGGTVLLEDIASPDAGDRIAHALAGIGLDIVVHNAGITRDKTLARMKPELWDLTMAVNLTAVLTTTERLLNGTIRDGGRIIGLSSIAGIAGNMGQTNYAASKSAIVRFVAALAPRVASRGITVNAIAPGFIETRLTAAIPFAIRELARRMNALGQGGQPEDIGQAIAFLASPVSQGVTGQTIRVCGGSLVGA